MNIFCYIDENTKELLLTNSSCGLHLTNKEIDILTIILSKSISEIEENKKIVKYINSINIFLTKDCEDSNWKQIIFTIVTKESNFDKRIEIWEKIDSIFIKIIKKMKKDNIDSILEINKIDDLIAFEVI